MNKGKGNHERLIVLGGGISGEGIARLGLKLGYDVLVSDAGILDPARRARLEALGARIEEGGHRPDSIRGAELVVKSPGIPNDSPLIAGLRASGQEVIGELEFAARHIQSRLVCVTGSNGKTTTVSLIQHILQLAGLRAALVGNVGQSFAGSVAEQAHDIYVVEVSSFQLEDTIDFRAQVGVLLNITPDHLDRYHNDLGQYAAAKLRIARNMRPEDSFIFNADDANTLHFLSQGTAPAIGGTSLSFTHGPRAAVQGKGVASWRDEGAIHLELPGRPAWSIREEELSLQGRHNLQNCQAASIACALRGVEPEVIREGLRTFRPIAHRMEYIGTLNGVRYINDSKATNVDATWYALEAQRAPVVWIVGGQDKGNDYDRLQELVRARVRGIVCLGVDNRKLRAAFGSLTGSFHETQSVAEAIRLAQHIAQPGDTVLLSPACASFDLFKSYEDRGDQFREEVRRHGAR